MSLFINYGNIIITVLSLFEHIPADNLLYLLTQKKLVVLDYKKIISSFSENRLRYFLLCTHGIHCYKVSFTN